MKLVASKIEHSDTIVGDDGQTVGAIYYNVQPLNDELETGAVLFRRWWKANEEKQKIATELALKARQLVKELKAVAPSLNELPEQQEEKEKGE